MVDSGLAPYLDYGAAATSCGCISLSARGLPVLSWTVRTAEQWQAVRRFGDAAIFEGEAQTRHG